MISYLSRRFQSRQKGLRYQELRDAAKRQFEQDTKEIKYFSLLPPGAKPPLDLNKEIMEKYRPAMSKYYLNRRAQFK
jgi:aminobenzoyl-glutamate utilization protein B